MNGKKYNYDEAVQRDIDAYLTETYPNQVITDDMRDDISDALWISDSVTGNGSGSYTMSSIAAERNLMGNWGLMWEAIDELGMPERKDPESMDVMIRLYLVDCHLGSAIAIHNETVSGN